MDAGADGVVVSLRGGRQDDRTVPPIRLLANVIGAVGDRGQVLVETGIVSGADLVAAVGLGATAVLVGRTYTH